MVPDILGNRAARFYDLLKIKKLFKQKEEEDDGSC